MAMLIRASSAQTKHCPRDLSTVTSGPKESGDGFQTRARGVLAVCHSLPVSRRGAGRPPPPSCTQEARWLVCGGLIAASQPSTLMIREKSQREGVSILFEPLPLGGTWAWRLQLPGKVGPGGWVPLVAGAFGRL